MSSPNIAIVGAGPASLTLAAILHRHNIHPTIYESSLTLRHQGGSLDLHPHTGQQALREAGLWSQFVQHSRPESDVKKMVDLVTGEVHWDENAKDKIVHGGPKTKEELLDGRPEIDRGALTDILFDALPEGSVKWGKKVIQVIPGSKKDQYDICFADGTKDEGFDLVVGGDGAWSRVRKLLTTTRPQYSGISGVAVWHNNLQGQSWVDDYVGAGSCFSFGDKCAVLAQRQGNGTSRTLGRLAVPETFISECGIDWNDKDTARTQFVNRYLGHIAPDLQRLILDSTDSLAPSVFYELPIGFRWESRPGVTLIGDAAHLMTPFAGVGVNVGMTDALVLAKEIVAVFEKQKSLEEAVKTYEEEMWPRAQKYMEKTEKNKRKHFEANGSKEFADMIRAHYAGMKNGK